MKTHCLVLALVLAWGSAAWAERVQVTSGEHADFSRLALVFASAIGWRERRTATGYEVVFDRGGLEMDLSRVYDKIPRDRYASLAFDPATSTLRIETGCRCALDAFDVRPGVLALDLRESADVPPPPIAEVLPLGLAAPLATPGLPFLPLQPVEAPGPAVLPEAQQADAFRRSLERQIDRAAANGLVTLTPEAAERPAAEDALVTAAPEERISSEEGNAAPAPGLPAQIRITDSATPSERRDLPEADEVDRTLCASASAVSLDFAPEEEPARALASARMGLVDDAGRPSPDALRRLFGVYIAYDMGAEARLLAREWGDMMGQTAAAEALLAALEDRPTDYFSPRRGCSDGWAFWALLSEGATPPDGEDGLRGVDSYFRGLSAQLQNALFPRLSRQLVAIGAQDLVYSLERARELTAYEGDGPLPELDDARATGPMLSGVPEEIEATDPEAPSALAATLAARLERPGGIEESLVDLVLSMAVETRGEAISEELRALAAIAILRNGNTERAFDLWDDLSPTLPEATRRETRARLLSEVADLDDAAAFVSVVFARAPWRWAGSIDPQTTQAIGERLGSLGFRPEVIASLGLTPPANPAMTLANGVGGVGAGSELRAQQSRIQALLEGRGAAAPAPDAPARNALDLGIAQNRELLDASREARRLMAEILGDPEG